MIKNFILFGLMFVSVGCMKPYDVPEYVDIGNSETAILLPLDGKTSDQESFQSEEYLKKNMVAKKRIQIPHEWRQTGRWSNDGEWVPTVSLISVDRAPETRKWTPDGTTGTSATNEGLWAESSDSVGFSTGIECTARIPDHDSAIRFLYNYPAVDENNDTGLANIMDKEIRTQIQARLSEFSNFFTMDELRGQKSAMMTYIKYGELPDSIKPSNFIKEPGVIEFFEDRGIEITTIGQFGGFTYSNIKIQDAIDKVFEAQQEEEVAKAESLAQKERNEAVKLAAEGKAEAVRLEAQGEADAIQTVADAKAYEIEKAQENWEQYLSLKQIELEEARLNVWDGKYPVTLFGGMEAMGSSNILITTPKVD